MRTSHLISRRKRYIVKTAIAVTGLLLALTGSYGSSKINTTHKVLFLTDYYGDYVKEAQANNGKADSLFKEKVAQPIFDKYFSSSDYSFLIKQHLSGTIRNTTELEKTIGRINEERETIIKDVMDALTDAGAFIKNDSITVYILPAGRDNLFLLMKMEGVTAVTAGSKQIVLSIEPQMNGWENMLKYSVAHEYHHTCWTKNNLAKLPSWTLLNYLVFEGRADSYAHLVYPNIQSPWTGVLTAEQKAKLWGRIKGELESTDVSLQQQVMFGSFVYPYWGGYSLGYDIVQTFLKNNKNISPDDWTNLDAETILSKSDYK
jgi:uncharacterized protein YjaZ